MCHVLIYPIFPPPVDFYDQTQKFGWLYLTRFFVLLNLGVFFFLLKPKYNSRYFYSPQKWAPKLFYWDIYDKKMTIRLKRFIYSQRNFNVVAVESTVLFCFFFFLSNPINWWIWEKTDKIATETKTKTYTNVH